MMRSLFCGGYYTFAILGLLNPPDGIIRNTVERMRFNQAADALQTSSSFLFADKYAELLDVTGLVNSRPGYFWPVGYTSHTDPNGSRREAICLALPIMWGAYWLESSICTCGDDNKIRKAREKLEALRQQCCSYLEGLEKNFDWEGGWIYEIAPIAQAVADAWKAVRSLGAVLLLTSPSPVSDLRALPEVSHVA